MNTGKCCINCYYENLNNVSKIITLVLQIIQNLLCIRSIRYEKAASTKSILQAYVDRPKQCWQNRNRFYPTKSMNKQNSEVFEIDGKQTLDFKAILNRFCSFFANIGKTLQRPIPALSKNI